MITFWFGAVVLAWVLFFVLEGFDFGVGLLAPLLGRDDHERGAAIRTIGPFWDGNEVWLVAAIGATFAAFPGWYAALLAGLYLPMAALLLLLAVRGVALEFRGKGEGARWRRRCELAVAASSAGIVLLWGALLAVFVRGLALGPSGAVSAGVLSGGSVSAGVVSGGSVSGGSVSGGSVSAGVVSGGSVSGGSVSGDSLVFRGGGLGRSIAPLLTPAAGFGALAALFAAALLGATFLSLRTSGPVRRRARRLARWLGPGGAAALVLAGVGTATPAVLAAAVLAFAAGLLSRYGREALAFAVTAAGVAGTVIAVFTANGDVILRSTLNPDWSLTLQSAAATESTLELMTVAGAAILPGVLTYQIWSYLVFRRRVASERVPS